MDPGGMEFTAQRSLWQRTRHSQIEICMHRRSSCIYEESFGKNSAKDHKIALLRGIQFIESSHSCDITMFQAMKIPDAQVAVDKE